MRARRLAVAALLAAAVAWAFPSAAGAGNPWLRIPVGTLGARSNYVIGVDCVDTLHCFAVGYWIDDQFNVRGLILRTTDGGATWTKETSPRPSYEFLQYFDVSCTTTKDCMAVGQYLYDYVNGRPDTAFMLIRTMNGGVSWNRVGPAPPLGQPSALGSVSCVTPIRCRAVGVAGTRPLIMRTSNGSSWFREPDPTTGLGTGTSRLQSVDCVNNAWCTAVGAYRPTPNSTLHTLTMRWEGGAPWKVVPSPNPAPSTSDAILDEVSCPTTTTCVAVGEVWPDRPGAATPHRGLIVRTVDGQTWKQAATPVIAELPQIASVVCSSPTECTAVGGAFNAAGNRIERNLILRTTDGTGWASPEPASDRPSRSLFGLSCPGPAACLGVGIFDDTGDLSPRLPQRALIMKES